METVSFRVEYRFKIVLAFVRPTPSRDFPLMLSTLSPTLILPSRHTAPLLATDLTMMKLVLESDVKLSPRIRPPLRIFTSLGSLSASLEWSPPSLMSGERPSSMLSCELMHEG